LGSEVSLVARFVAREVRLTGLLAWRNLQLATPVDTGRARASWNLSTGRPDLSVPPPVVGVKRLPRPTRHGHFKVEPIESGTTVRVPPVFIASGLSYMPVLARGQHLDGGVLRGSEQQPSPGWVERAVERAVHQADGRSGSEA
jgi:hypothetical protein